jgi:site-specific DNA-methyltransferase (adenine-specific)
MNMKELYNKADYKDELGMCFKGDCLDIMKNIPDKSVDMILCDLPYGTTACKWDMIIPFEPLWEQYNRVIKDNRAIVLFGSEPFSSALRMSNIKNYKYDWIWEKEQGANFMLCKYQPYKVHEIISVFSKNKHMYIPQMTEGKPYISGKGTSGDITGNVVKKQTKNKGTRYPRSIQRFNTDKAKGSLHPTQKPVALCEYLIKTYTNEGEIVLDNCMGSGTTCVACKNTNRKYIGIELDENYFKVACNRLRGVE